MMYKHRKQDSLFYVGSETGKEFFKHLQILVLDMFRSDCPIFMPIEYSNIVELRLDNNIISYEKIGDSKYNLVDKFAANGGPPIVLAMGAWAKANGSHYKMRLNRWDRRTDLMGTKFINTLWEAPDNRHRAYFHYSRNGTIIGSGGTLQEQVSYITDRLNLTVETTNETRMIDGKPREIWCHELMNGVRNHTTNICSGGYFSMYPWKITTEPPTKFEFTLLAGVETENNLDAWVYINVFGLSQWILYLSALAVTSFVMLISQILLDENFQRPPIIEQFAMTYLFLLQQGNHPASKHLAKRILSVTLSMVTLLVFVYYTNDITAKMTAGSTSTHVRNFEDVLDGGYKVIVVDGVSRALGLLHKSKENTAKHSVYKLYIEEDHKKILEYKHAIKNGRFEEAEKIELPNWHAATQENYDWAEKQITMDKKTLWYCTKGCASDAISKGKIIALPMDDATKSYSGLLVTQDSEFIPVIRHYVLKGLETGIFQRIELSLLKHCIARDNKVCRPFSRPGIKIGMTEPAPLGINNVMFPFSLIVAGLFTSISIAIVEKLIKMVRTITH